MWLRPDGLGFQRGTRHKTNNAYAQLERDLRDYPERYTPWLPLVLAAVRRDT